MATYGPIQPKTWNQTQEETNAYYDSLNATQSTQPTPIFSADPSVVYGTNPDPFAPSWNYQTTTAPTGNLTYQPTTSTNTYTGGTTGGTTGGQTQMSPQELKAALDSAQAQAEQIAKALSTMGGTTTYTTPSGAVVDGSGTLVKEAPKTDFEEKLMTSLGEDIPSHALGTDYTQEDVFTRVIDAFDQQTRQYETFVQEEQAREQRRQQLQSQYDTLMKRGSAGILNVEGQAIPQPLIGLQAEKLKEQIQLEALPLTRQLEELGRQSTNALNIFKTQKEMTQENIENIALLGDMVQQARQAGFDTAKESAIVGLIQQGIKDPGQIYEQLQGRVSLKEIQAALEIVAGGVDAKDMLSVAEIKSLAEMGVIVPFGTTKAELRATGFSPSLGGGGVGDAQSYQSQKASNTIQSTQQLISQALSNPDIFGRSAALPLPDFLRSDAYRNFKAELDTLRSNIAFGELQAMRNASKTGGALGQVSERELGLLQSALGALSMDQSPANVVEQLQRIQQSLLNFQYASTATGQLVVADDGQIIEIID